MRREGLESLWPWCRQEETFPAGKSSGVAEVMDERGKRICKWGEQEKEPQTGQLT